MNTHTTLRSLLDRYTTWSAESSRIQAEEPHSSRAREASDDEALTLLHEFAAAAGVLDIRPSGLVDDLGDALHDEWPGLLNDGLQRSVARSLLRLIVGQELALTDAEPKPAEPTQWGSIILAARHGIPGFADVELCRWQRDADGYWRSEIAGVDCAWVSPYEHLTHVAVISRGTR